MTEIINLELEGTWNVRVQLGAWVGTIVIPKALEPVARDAHQRVLDAAWKWVDSCMSVDTVKK